LSTQLNPNKGNEID